MITIKKSQSLDVSIRHILPLITTTIQLCIEENNEIRIALAGGNTPKPLYRALKKENLEWDKVYITLTDERWVSTADDNSNEKMIKEFFIDQLHSSPQFIPLKNHSSSATLGMAECHSTLEKSLPNLDLIILGMGEDGHFASIFPGVDNLDALLDQQNSLNCMAVTPLGKEERISLTLKYLLTAKMIILFITGDEKKSVIESVLAGNQESSQYPITHIIQQNICPVHIYWNP